MPMVVLLLVLQPFATLRHGLEQIASQAHGRVGAAAMLLETGESVSIHGADSFPMQSVYKLPISMAVLDRIDHGALTLAQRVEVGKGELVPKGVHSPIRDQHPDGTVLTVEELVRFALVESDGSASDVLLKLAGGPEEVTGFLVRSGVSGIAVATSEAEMATSEKVQYRNSASPESLVHLLRALHDGKLLSPESRKLLDRCMTETGTGPRRLKGLLPSGTRVAHKTGTSATAGGMTRATNDAGIITLPNGNHIAIAVLIADSTASEDIRDSVIARIARAIWEAWGTGAALREN